MQVRSLQKSLFYVKNYEDLGQGAEEREFWYSSSKFYSDITQWIPLEFLVQIV